MKFGYFDDDKKEYVIQRPDTPYPWINYLGFSEFFSLISNTAGGYSFFTDALFRRITRYRYNNVPLDDGGRYFYIKEGDTIWSPGWKPVKTKLDFYECHHGMGYTKIKGIKNELEAEVLFFVPIDYSGEVQQLCLKNLSSSVKKIKLFSFVEFCLWNALDDMSNFQRNFSTGEVEVDKGVIYHKTEYRERRNYYSFYSVSQQPQGFDTDRDSFIGLYNGFHEPEVVLNGVAKNSIAEGWASIASHYFEFTLKPGEQKELIFILGFVENDRRKKWQKPGIVNKEKALKMIKAYQTTQHVQKDFIRLKKHWEKLLANFQIQVDDERLMRMVNIWNQYQCIVTYNMSRSASYFESGIGRGIGFRDTNQDILGCVHQIPEIVKQRILDVAATQLKDGGAYHQYQPLTKHGNDAVGSNFNDDPLWLILAVSAYIKETGDWKILDQVVDFENNSQLAAPMMEHLRRAFMHVVNNKGPHNLPLIGRADWNDCLNLNCFSTTPNESFQTCTNKDGKTAESILIAGMFVLIGKEWVEICRRKGLTQEAQEAEQEIQKIHDALLKHGWDGEWYLRAYDDAGQMVGSKNNKEGKIYVESQGFCAMAQIGKDRGYPIKALDSVTKYLDTKHGIILHNPAYTRYYLNLGEISTYPQGYKENAGIFCHNNPWIMIGEAIAGRANKAWQYYKKIAPAWREDISDVHRLEPYVYAQMIAGKDGRRFGEAKNSWLTGTAAWNFVAISQWILGIRPEYDGLYIDPCLPDHIKEYTVWRAFRGNSYKIQIKNPNAISKGIKSAKLNGKDIVKTAQGGILITVDNTKVELEIEIIMG